MIGARRSLAAGLALVALTACAAVPEAVRRSSDPVAAPAPAPAPIAAPRPVPTAPARFAFEGAMTQGGLVLGTAPAGTMAVRFGNENIPLAPDRRFVIAFDRDAGPTATITAVLADGRRVDQPLSVAPRAWRIERLNTLPRVSTPSAEFQRRRPAELARIRAARVQANEVGGWRQAMLWPATGRISGLFGAQRVYRGEPGSYHSGVDVARPTGTPILSPADGVVVLAANDDFTLEGKLLIVDHGMGLNSAFLHLSRIDVREGDRVARGQTLGAIGTTGRSTGPHLHWGMMWRGSRIDPLLLAGPMPTAE